MASKLNKGPNGAQKRSSKPVQRVIDYVAPIVDERVDVHFRLASPLIPQLDFHAKVKPVC